MNRGQKLLVVGGLGLLVLFVVFWVCGGFSGWRSVVIADASQPVDFTVTSTSWDCYPLGHPSGVSVWVTGEITGEAEVWADYWEPKRLSGRVDWRVYHDWFGDTCLLHYKPIGPVSGNLVVRYQFH